VSARLAVRRHEVFVAVESLPPTGSGARSASGLPAVGLEGVVKRFGDVVAVDGNDLEIADGEFFSMLGPSGAGKTTTLRMIAGILRPSSGTIRIAGIDVATDPMAAKRKLGFIPDRPFIYEKLTGVEFLRFVAGLYGQSGEDVERRGRELLALFDLEEWRDELVESYSHGMRQKLIISSALVHKPEVIVVDEPMVGLDPKAAKTLKDLYREYTRRGNTIMMSTHTLEVAESMCDRIGIIQRGVIRACGTMDDLRASAESGVSGLEEIFLRLTGEGLARELVEVLDA
jgi:ABC-2 type transport system ATP-binding protein